METFPPFLLEVMKIDGLTFFVTILVALILGYFQGVKTRRKKIICENNELKKQNRKLMNEIKRLKTLKFDNQIKNGIINKKGISEFINDFQFLVDVDSSNFDIFLSLYALLKHSNVDDVIVSISRLEGYLKILEKENDYINIRLKDNEISIDVWEISNHLNQLFNHLLNIKEYEITETEMKDALYEKLCELNQKKQKNFPCSRTGQENKLTSRGSH